MPIDWLSAHSSHSSGLNHAEIYFSVVQRKVLIPNDFTDLDNLQPRILESGRR